MKHPTPEDVMAFKNSCDSLRERCRAKNDTLIAAVKLVHTLQVEHIVLEWRAQFLYWTLSSGEAVDSKIHDSRNIRSDLRLFRVELDNLVDNMPHHLSQLDRLAAKLQLLELRFRQAGFEEGLPGVGANADVFVTWSNLQWDLKWLWTDAAGIEQIDQYAKASERARKHLTETDTDFENLRESVFDDSRIADERTSELLDRLQIALDGEEITEDDSSSDEPPKAN
jgi:hypothetical protein